MPAGCLTSITSFFSWIFGCQTSGPPIPGALPAYVERGGEQVFPQPFLFDSAVVHAFIVQAEYRALKSLCDKQLNDPSGRSIEYWPAGDRIVVARLDVGHAQPEQPAEYDYGFLKEADTALFIPLVGFRGGIPVSMGMYAPYLFVDHPWGVLSGREVYGLHKIPSRLSAIPTSASVFFEVESYAVQNTGTGLEIPQQRVLSILQGAPPPPPPRANFVASGVQAADPAEVELGDQVVIRDGKAAWDAVLRSLFGPRGEVDIPMKRIVVSVNNFLTYPTAPLLTLKQFRHVADGRKACYQAILESPATGTGFTTRCPWGAVFGCGSKASRAIPYSPISAGTRTNSRCSAAWKISLDFKVGAAGSCGEPRAWHIRRLGFEGATVGLPNRVSSTAGQASSGTQS